MLMYGFISPRPLIILNVRLMVNHRKIFALLPDQIIPQIIPDFDYNGQN